jgi:hypothetical protein
MSAGAIIRQHFERERWQSWRRLKWKGADAANYDEVIRRLTEIGRGDE